MNTHVHEFSPRSGISQGKHRKAKPRDGFACECGLIAFPPKKITPGGAAFARWQKKSGLKFKVQE